MSYTAPVNELRFGIRVHGRLDEILQLPHAEGLDAETVDAVLDEAARFASEQWADTNRTLLIVYHGHNARALAGAAVQHGQQVGGGGGIHGVERFIQQQHTRTLHQHAGKQHALKLPAGKSCNRLARLGQQAHLIQRRMHARPLLGAQAAPPAQLVP